MTQREPGIEPATPSRERARSISAQKAPGRVSARRLRLPRSLAFFALFYAYFAVEIDVRLFYNCGGLIDSFPAFYRGWDFFQGFLSYPGGIVEYLSALLAQSFYYSWLGAAVVTGQAWALCACTDYAIRAFGAPRGRGLRFLGPLLLLAIYSQYGFHFLTTMGLLAALLGFCLYVRFASEDTVRALLFFLAVSVILYIAAAGPYLLFVLLCVLHVLLRRGRPIPGLAQLAAGAAIPYVLGGLVYGVRVYDAYFELLPFSWKLMRFNASQIMVKAVYVLYLFLPVAVAVGGISRLLFGRTERLVSPQTHINKRTDRSQRRNRIRAAIGGMLADKSSGALGLNLQTLTLVTVTVVTVLLFRDPKLRNLFRVDYFSRHGRWAEVIEIGRRSPYHYLICHAVNRALCQTGRFGDEMFRFPQRPSALLLTGKEAPWQKFDTCLEMGLVNQAENAMTISLEMYGERPLLLQRLATVSLAKGNVRVAGVFLRALEKVPFWRSKARQSLAQLKDDPELLQSEEIQRLRRVMLKTDYVGGADTLTLLLTENPRNRMAYEYGMASLLLSKNLDDFVKIFNRYHRLNATRIPRHYEEALLLSRVLKRQPIDVPGQKIAAQTKRQLHEFLQAVQTGGKAQSATKSTLKQTLRAEFGTTYFYYYFFGS